MLHRPSVNCNLVNPQYSRCRSFVQFRLCTDWIVGGYICVTLLVCIGEEIWSNLLVSRWRSHFGIFRGCWVLVAPKTFSVLSLKALSGFFTIITLFLWSIIGQSNLVCVIIQLMGSKNRASEIMVVQNSRSCRLTGSINDIASGVTRLEMQGSNAPSGYITTKIILLDITFILSDLVLIQNRGDGPRISNLVFSRIVKCLLIRLL